MPTLRRKHTGLLVKLRNIIGVGKAALTAPDALVFTVKDVALCINLDQCNLRCIMCWQTYDRESNRGSSQQANMSYENLHRLLRNRLLQHATISIVGGGEPFLYPHMNEILTEAPTRGRRLMIMTNGTLLSANRTLWEAAERAALTLSFSIDAATPATYEQIRQGGSWPELMANIEKTIALRERNPQLHISTSFVVLRQNLHELIDFMRLNASWGSEYVHIHHAIQDSFPSEWLVDTCSREYQHILAQAVEFARGHSIALDSAGELGLLGDYASSTPELRQGTREVAPTRGERESSMSRDDPRRACRLHSNSMTVSVSGEVYLCDTAFRAEYSCGNIFTGGLLNAWLSPAWLSVRLAHRQGRQHEHPLCSRCLLVRE